MFAQTPEYHLCRLPLAFGAGIRCFGAFWLTAAAALAGCSQGNMQCSKGA